jgi:diguanylate cyclase (GGDEF)-like protein/PAS domain S-box-containing protein
MHPSPTHDRVSSRKQAPRTTGAGKSPPRIFAANMAPTRVATISKKIISQYPSPPLRPLVLMVTQDRDFTNALIRPSPGPYREDSVQIECVEHVMDAVHRLKTNNVQAIIADWELPNTTGLETIWVLQGAAPQVPLLIVGDDDAIEHITAEHGAQGFSRKQGLSTFALGLLVQMVIARKRRDSASTLDKNRSRLMLDSIGDAVLSTDGDSLITFLNPIAERLVGWSNAEAAGRPLPEVFQVIDGATRERIVPHLAREVQKGLTMILAPNCILVRRDGSELHIEDSAAPMRGLDGEVVGMVVVFHDVGEARAITQRMAHLAKHDALTSLPNRALLDDRLERGIALAQRNGREMAVLFVDLDHFKHINDSLGHLIGDQLLKAAAQRISPCLRGCDTVSRHGGDEFIVLLTELQHSSDALIIAEKIRLALMEPYMIAEHLLQLSASIGISVFPGDGADAQTLIHCADTAMYHAKEKGRNNSQFFREDMNVRATARQIIIADLRNAIARNEFLLHYQTKVSLSSGAVTGVEALIRWRHPTRGVLQPDIFIPIAEDSGLITAIGRWVLREACMQAQQWLEADLQFGTMAVNISAVEFRSDKFFAGVCDVLKDTGLAAHHLELELTETAVMQNFEETRKVLQGLSTMGVRIAVDDFGTGYSNLSYLKRFPINTLKLDRSFISDIPQDADVSTIVKSVIQMAHSLHLQVVAEGVENSQQLKFLQAQGCGEGQGYYFSKPLRSAKCSELLSRRLDHGCFQPITPVQRSL